MENNIIKQLEPVTRAIGLHPEDFLAACVEYVLHENYALMEVLENCASNSPVDQDVDHHEFGKDIEAAMLEE